MEKLKMQTADGVQDNISRIAELFPECITEVSDKMGGVKRSVDFDKLRQLLSSEIVEGNEERYQFTWPDKRKAILAANAPINATLRPCREESVDFDTTQNLYIEGDNLDVLKCLKETYLHKVKMIYIDPPYNTGNDFVYEDDFAESASEYLANSGQFDEQGNRLVTNTESNGRFHTDWLNMIYPRLRVARDLLTEDGVIFISIDENELENLKKVCDEIFGESNFIAEFIWSAGRKNDSKYISVSHEYVVCYFRNAEYIKEHKIVWREKKRGLDDIYNIYNALVKKYGDDYANIEKELKKWYKNLPDGHPAKDHKHYCRVDKRGIYFADNISWPGGGGPKYEVLHPLTRKPVKIPSRGWITSEKNLKEWIKEDRVDFGENENSVPTIKAYLKDREYAVPYSVFYQDGRAASKRLATLMGDKVFENPKDEEVIERIIEFCGTNDGDIILDFFSGSATTAHSVFLANIEQNLNRRFILVQIPELIDASKGSEKSKKVAKNAINLLDSMKVPHTICEIGKERIRRAGAKIKEENPEKAQKLDKGFRVLKLDSSNMKEVFYSPKDTAQQDLFSLVDNVKPDRTSGDLLFQVMLELGATLDSKIEESMVDGKTIYNVGDGYLVACFDQEVSEDVVKAIAKMQPMYAVLRDTSMADDATTTNFEQIFKTYAPNTTTKIL